MTAPSLREAAQMALEALDRASATLGRYDIPGTQNWIVSAMQPALESLRAALALPDAEPIGYRYKDSESMVRAMPGYKPGPGWSPLYEALQPAPSVPDAEPVVRKPLNSRRVKSIMESAINGKSEMGDMEYVGWIIEAVERAHNIQGAA